MSALFWSAMSSRMSKKRPRPNVASSTSATELSNDLQTFKNLYEEFNHNLSKDWKVLSDYSNDYYVKYMDGKLEENEKEKFDLVSVNLFLRFQTFSDLVNRIDNIYEIKSLLDKASHKIKSLNKKIDKKNIKISDNILTIEEAEEFL